jgi:hypothetical protein
MMAVLTAIEDPELPPHAECWCCGRIEVPDRVVRLGNHPEVAVCIRCAYSLKTWARAIEDRDRTGLAVRVRAAIRRGRRGVIRRGWRQHGPLARPLRWLGRRLR